MAVRSARPLPRPPIEASEAHPINSDLVPIGAPYPYPTYWSPTVDVYDEAAPMLPAGAVLHRGFYDLLAMIPTPSPSRLLWRATQPQRSARAMASPRYEEINPKNNVNSGHALPSLTPPKKARKISKDMVSPPTCFVWVFKKKILTTLSATFFSPDIWSMLLMPIRRKPCLLGGAQMEWESWEVSVYYVAHVTTAALPTPDPQWANPIKSRVRQNNQERAINEVVNALKPSSNSGGQQPPLRVMNGVSTTTSSTLTNCARENVYIGPTEALSVRLGLSTNFLGGTLQSYPELCERNGEERVTTHVPKRRQGPIIPSLATLEKAVSARIYFENLYFPLLRQPPSREQRRVAMERDMSAMDFGEEEKDALRARWIQNETDYLRERRRKVDATAFIKLKTIGHGTSFSESE